MFSSVVEVCACLATRAYLANGRHYEFGVWIDREAPRVFDRGNAADQDDSPDRRPR